MRRAAAVCVASAVLVSSAGWVLASPAGADAPPMVTDPCAGIASLVSRPSISTSACTVSSRHVLIESGYSNSTNSGNQTGASTSVPQMTLRTGIGPGSEIEITLPSLMRSGGAAVVAGASDIGFGIKGLRGFTSRAVYSVGATATLPTGSRAYTSGAPTYALMGNGSYMLDDRFSLFGTATLASSVGAGPSGARARFGSFDPSAGVTYAFPSQWSLYAEAARVGRIAPGLGGQSLVDYGVQKTIGEGYQVDAEAGDALNAVGGVRFHYIGAGVSVLFGSSAQR